MMQKNNKPLFPLLSTKRLGILLGISPAQLRVLASEAGRHYKSFDLWKGHRDDGSDKWRHIDNPSDPLRPLQDKVYNQLLRPLADNMPQYLTGGMPGRSIIDNASPHLGMPVVIGLDIENCFPSIPHKRIFEVWRNELGCSSEVAALLTQLTTYQGRLPQGAPTSPMLCNLALAPLARAIHLYATESGLIFTIYVDDITLSGYPSAARAAIVHMIPLVQQHGYKISKDKAAIMDSNEVQKTTGLLVNNQAMTLQRGKLQKIRRDIYTIAGLGQAATTYQINQLWGKIHFVKSINPVKGAALAELAKNEIGDIKGTYASKPKDRIRPCQNIRNRH